MTTREMPLETSAGIYETFPSIMAAGVLPKRLRRQAPNVKSIIRLLLACTASVLFVKVAGREELPILFRRAPHKYLIILFAKVP